MWLFCVNNVIFTSSFCNVQNWCILQYPPKHAFAHYQASAKALNQTKIITHIPIIMRKIILFSVFSIVSFLGFSQDFSNKGKEFWLCFPSHVPSGANLANMSLFITSDKNSSGVVTYNGQTQNFSVIANQVTEVLINRAAAYITDAESGAPVNKGIKVKVNSGQPAIVVYSHIYAGFRTAATLALPVNVLGKQYRTMSYFQVGGGGRSQFQVIAVDTNTVVQVQLVRNGAVSGAPFTITLPNIGDVWQIQDNQDLSGTLLESVALSNGRCKKIAVFSGSSALSLGRTGCNGNSLDPLNQQCYPVSTWGKNFGVVPIVNNNNGYQARVMASENNTNISYNGTAVTLNAGEVYPPIAQNVPAQTQPIFINADKPVSVSQYLMSQACANAPQIGDPDMVILNPIEQNIKDVTLFTSSRQSILQQHMNVLIQTIAAPSFRLIDAFGNTIPTAAFTPMPGNPAYSYLRHTFPVSQTSYTLRADSGFNVMCYGLGDAESYAYSGGTNVKDLYQQIGVTTTYGIEQTPSVCTGTSFRFKVSIPYCADSIKWDLSNLPGPQVQPPTQFYTQCTVGAGGPDSITTVNGISIFWYSLPGNYNLTTTGIYPVTITTFNSSVSNPCGNEQDIDFDLEVSAPPVATFTITPPGCYLEPATFLETTPQTPKATYRWYWDFGDGNISTSKNPQHTYATPGTYNVRFASITTPGCLSDTIPLPVIVPELPEATLSGTSTVCINTTPQQITFTGTKGQAPYEFSYTLNGVAQVPIISSAAGSYTLAVPVTTAGQFIYQLTSVKNVGSTLCTQNIANQADTVTVLPDATLALTSAAGTNNQTVCINNAIGNITYAVGGSGTNSTVTFTPALPGVTGVYNAGVLTIAGTPTLAGTFNYVVATDGPCIKPTASGSIIVTEDATINLSSATGTDNQTTCINTALPLNITYAVGGSGNGGSVTGLPLGVTGTYAGGVITIQGTPTQSGTFSYTVNTTGPCIKPSVTGTIIVTADATLALTSAAGTDNQTICINNAINNITYAVGVTGTGGAVSGLPTGVTGTYAGGVITITGTPTQSGTFSYTVTTNGPCVKPSLGGTLTVTGDAVLTLTSLPATTSQSVCLNTAINNVTYAVTGTGNGGTVTGLPTGIIGTYAGGLITITGTPSQSGTFNYTVTTTGPCVKPSLTGTITVFAYPTPNFTTNTPLCETRDITFTDNSNPQAGTLTNWVWNYGDGNTGTGITTTHNYPIAGVYNVSLTVTTSNGCSNPVPFSIPVTINNRPKAGFIVPEVCINDIAAIFTDTSKIAGGGGFNPAGYEWQYGDASPLTFLQNGSHLYTAVGIYNVRHIVTSTAGCKDTVTNPISINGADPLANFSIASAATLCANDSVAITNLSTIAQGNITKVHIYWDAVGAPAVFEIDEFPIANKIYKHKYPNFQTPAIVPYNIRFVAFSGSLCQDDDIKNITLNAAPRVQFNNIPDVCYTATPFVITQGSEVGGVPGTFAYTGPGITNTNGLFNPAVAGIGTHTIRYTFTSTAASCVDTASKTIRVLDTASAKFSFVAPICQGVISTFREESTAPAGVVLTNTVWDFGDGTPTQNFAPGSNVTHTYANWGSYTVTMYNTSAYGCRSASKQQAVYISPIPQTAFSFNETSVCLPNAVVSFNNTSTIADNSQNQFTYLWDFGDPASGALNSSVARIPPPHRYSDVGPYTVRLTVTSGSQCVNSFTLPVNFINPQPKTVFNFSKPEVCIGDNVVISDLTDGLNGTITQWFWTISDGSVRNTNTVDYVFGSANTFNVSLYTINSQGCNSDTLTKPFTVHPYPSVNAGPDRVVLEGGSITLQPVVTGNDLQYLWTPNTYLNNDKIEMPTASNMLDDITYTLTVTGRGGCAAPPDNMFVKVLKAPKIPNTFTPNGDGINETWKIEYLDSYPNNKVQVFTRTGQLVFESKGYKTPWDGRFNGKSLPFDTYYYIIEPSNGRKAITGYVTIVK